jgi:hypothetical protein
MTFPDLVELSMAPYIRMARGVVAGREKGDPKSQTQAQPRPQEVVVETPRDLALMGIALKHIYDDTSFGKRLWGKQRNRLPKVYPVDAQTPNVLAEYNTLVTDEGRADLAINYTVRPRRNHSVRESSIF